MKSKISKDLISFVTIRRGNWIMKISVYRTKEVLVLAQHYFEIERFIVNQFINQEEAAAFLDMLASED
jgi:hypothetical protein